MIKKVVKGDFYAVATESECVVTSATGKPLGTATAGNPVTFPATTDEVEISDPDADFVRVNPNSAPAKLMLYGLLGRGKIDALPAGYLAAEFLESTGRQYIKATAIFNNDTKLEMLARRTGASVNSSFFGTEHYGTANVATNRFCLLVDSAGKARFDYGPSSFYSDFVIKKGVCYKITKDAEKNYIDGVLVASNTPAVFAGLYGTLFSRGGGAGYVPGVGVLNCAIYWCNIFNSGKPEHAFVPALTEKGVPCMYDKVSKTPFYDAGGGSFIVGMTCKQALKLADLPAGGGSRTVSLPWEAQLDYGVYKALQTAKASGWTITVQYRDAEPDNAVYNKYAAFTTDDELKAAYPDYKNDLTTAGGWIYPLTSLTQHYDFFFQGCKAKYAVFDIPKITNSSRFAYGSSIEEYVINAPSLRGGYAFLGNYAVKVTGYFPDFTVGNWTFAGESVKEFYADFPKLERAAGMFDSTQLNKASVLQILGSLPSYTSGSHPLTIGIHVDHKTDEEVAAAIADAEAKMWTLSVQWKGTATAQGVSTFGLRRMPVYAKAGTMELPDGAQKTMLDWGHYVTNAEENGYQEFASVEEAKEYFNVEN